MRPFILSILAAWLAPLAAAQGGHVAPGYREAADGILYEFIGGDAGDESSWVALGPEEEAPPAAPELPPSWLGPVEGPDGSRGNAFGYWAFKPASRPYSFLPDSYLDDWQRETVRRWERHPYNLVWVYTTEPGPENNWAGWGPPPKGWTTRRDIPRTPEGAFLGNGLPWPPPGEPRGGWLHR
ncbi:MAG: hypothetical protein HY553_04515 [Elusimicrobia bacterium]|nr:hypothetical protein [Elusimicrobiota bacterium]